MQQSVKRISSENREALTGWLMALPAMVLIFTFLFLPFFMAFGLSFTNQRLVSPNPTEYVGLQNFKKLLSIRKLVLEPLEEGKDGVLKYPKVRKFTRNNPNYPKLQGMREFTSYSKGEKKVVILAGDPLFLKALLNTLYFVLVVVPCQGGLALLLALLLNRPKRGIELFRMLYFMPVVVSMVVVSILWRFIYDGQNGLLNSVLGLVSFGAFSPIDWLGRSDTAMPAIIVMSVWQGVGFHMVIWLAGLQNIPASRYEAAAIDGAGPLQKFGYITWPGLRSTAVFVFVVITMQAFGIFTQIDAMTNGGPLDSTQTVVFQAVERGYRKQDIAEGSAISVVYFIIVLLISFVQRYLTREKRG